MADIPTLEGPTLPPRSGGAPRQLVILLHGVGADGNDLIGLAPYFQQILPEALFLSPHAPQRYDMAPMGYQWFSLQELSPATRLAGVRGAAPILEGFIDDQLAACGLEDKDLALIGFSQGTMMALHVGLRRAVAPAGIVGYSGMLAGPEVLGREIRCRPPVLLTHGDADPVLPHQALPAAESALKAADVAVESHLRPGLAHGIDEDCIRLGMAFLNRVLGGDPTD